jgi:ATP-dependent RNA helicase DeaD
MDNTTDPTPAPSGEFETLIEPEASLPEMTFEELPEDLRQAMARAGWSSLMPVQAKSLPYLLSGQDLMVQSRTGSGKTGAFIMPIMRLLDPAKAQTQAMVLCPTRELARQVAAEAETLFAGTGLTSVTLYGGVAYGPQNDALRAGAHLVVGTPGRILDHLLRRNFTLDNLRVLVFDEADRMLSIGFYPDMKEIKRYLPKRRVSTFLFSATYPPYVLRLAEEFMDQPNFLSLSAKQVHVSDILHLYHETPGMDKDRCLVRILEIENPTSAIIFSNTKANVHYVAEVLKGFGYDAEELSADLTQAKREQVLARLRAGSLRFLVATDVAARGIDIPELSHVIQYEPPEDPESYVHRAGRTGRAGASGTAVTLVNIMEELAIKRIGARFGIDLVKRPAPTDEDVAAVVAERLTALLEAEVRKMPPLKKVRMQRFLPLAQELAASGDASILAMLLDERYQGLLHAVPERPEGASAEPGRERGERGGRRERERDGEHGRDARRERSERGERGEAAGRGERDGRKTRGERGERAERGERRGRGGKPVREPQAAGTAAQPAQDPAFTPPWEDGLPFPDEIGLDLTPEAVLDASGEAPQATDEGEPRKRKRRRRRRKKTPSSAASSETGGERLPVEEEPAEDIYADDDYGFHSVPAKPAVQASAARPAKGVEDEGPEEASQGQGEEEGQGEAKPKGRSRSRSRSRSKSKAKAEAPVAEAGAGSADRSGSKPAAPAAEGGEQTETAQAKPAAKKPARSRGKAKKPAEEASSGEPVKQFEYKPDEYKGIEWD